MPGQITGSIFSTDDELTRDPGNSKNRQLRNIATMTVHKTHKDIRSIRESQRRAPGVAGKMIDEANDYRGLIIVLRFREERAEKELMKRLEANPKKVLLPTSGMHTNFSNADTKIWVFSTCAEKNILNKATHRFCSNPAALPVFLLDNSPSAAALADVIWVVEEDGEVKEEGAFF